MLAGIGSVDVELVRVLEEARIPVGRSRQEQDAGPSRDVDTGERRALPRHAELGPKRALDAQRLLDEVGDPAAVFADPLLEVGALAEHLQREREQPYCRLLA